MKSLFLTITVLFICTNLALCLECFFGDQDKMDDVKSTLGGKPLMTCTKNTTKNLDSVQVERGGLTFKHDDECMKHGHVTVCYCNEDKCNTAHASTRLLVPLLALPTFII